MGLMTEQIDMAISEFFDKVDRRGRIARRLRRAMDRSAKYLRPKVNEWLDRMRTKIVRDLNRRFAKDLALDIATELTDWEWIKDDGKDILKPALLRILANGAEESFVVAGIEARFDVLNPRSVAWAERRCARLVKEVADETRDAIKVVIREGVKEGKAVPRIAKEIRPLVGLTERQMMATAHYEEWLIANRPELSRREVDRRVDVYARRKHRERADMISRTESAHAVDEGTLEGYEQEGVEEADILLGPNACDDCVALAGKNPYKMAEAHGVLPAHPQCECCWSPA